MVQHTLDLEIGRLVPLELEQGKVVPLHNLDLGCIGFCNVKETVLSINVTLSCIIKRWDLKVTYPY